MAVQFPFPTTEDDYFVSLPIEGLTPALLKLGVYHHTGYGLYRDGIRALLETVRREAPKPCKYCTKRKASRLFVVLKPQEEHRLLGFVVCANCADQFRADVGMPPARR